MARSGAAGLGGVGANAGRPSLNELRFQLHGDGEVYGVLDRAGPEVFFAESRERALAEVERANRVAELYPDLISIGHLRDMDAAWRAAHGLPALPEPAGRRVRVPDPAGGEAGASGGAVAGLDGGRGPAAPGGRSAGSTAAAPTPAGARGGLSRVIGLATEAAVREALRGRVEAMSRDARHTAHSAREVAEVRERLERPLGRLRPALRRFCGPRAELVETELWRAVRERGGSAAALLMRREPQVPSPPAAYSAARLDAAARAEAVRAAAWCGPVLERAARLLDSAAEAERHPTPDEALDALHARLRSSTETAKHDLRVARSAYRASPDMTAALRRAWSGLNRSEREAVRIAVPEVERLVTRARGRSARSHVR